MLSRYAWEHYFYSELSKNGTSLGPINVNINCKIWNQFGKNGVFKDSWKIKIFHYLKFEHAFNVLFVLKTTISMNASQNDMLL